MSAPIALTVFEIPDSERPGQVLSLAVCAFGRSIRISNTTEHSVHILLGGHEQVLSPSPYRSECVVVGLLVFRPAEDLDDFDFRAIGEARLVDQPVEIDALCVELLLPGGVPAVH
ncbi:MAG: hypothetical protein OXU81_13640 [Gammaproteobacteria bacterium]|nr:hypothetical protein [Gammaproteobacteria bacterium]